MTTRELMNDLTDSNPVAPGSLADALTTSEAEALLARILAEPRAVEPARRRRVAPVTWQARVAIAGAVAMAALAIGQLLPGNDARHPADRSLVALLNRTAGVAAAQAAPPPAAFAYLKTKSLSMATFADSAAAGGPFSVLVPTIDEQWISRDRHGGRRRTTPDGQLVFPGPRDRVWWILAGRPQLGQPSDETIPPSEAVGGDDLSNLPTETDDVYDAVKEHAQQASDVPTNAEMLVVIGDWLSDPSASPELRAALYRVAAKIDGIELVGPVKDAAGRPGTAIGITSNYSGTKTRQELIFNPDTGQALGKREVVLERVTYADGTPPFVDDSQAFISTGNVASTNATP